VQCLESVDVDTSRWRKNRWMLRFKTVFEIDVEGREINLCAQQYFSIFLNIRYFCCIDRELCIRAIGMPLSQSFEIFARLNRPFTFRLIGPARDPILRYCEIDFLTRATEFLRDREKKDVCAFHTRICDTHNCVRTDYLRFIKRVVDALPWDCYLLI